jgi:hypothetical protein
MVMFAQLSLGVHDDKRAAAFWEPALGFVRRPPRWDGDDWIVLEPPPGVPGCAIALDVVDSPAEEFPHTHIDLRTGGRPLEDEVDRLLALGAQRVDWQHYPENPAPGEPRYVVLADPEGNRFCVGEH